MEKREASQASKLGQGNVRLPTDKNVCMRKRCNLRVNIFTQNLHYLHESHSTDYRASKSNRSKILHALRTVVLLRGAPFCKIKRVYLCFFYVIIFLGIEKGDQSIVYLRKLERLSKYIPGILQKVSERKNVF